MTRHLALGLPDAPGERRLVVVLCAMTLLLWIGGSAIIPQLPTYLRHSGASPALVGAVMASYFAFGVLTQFPVGRLADRVGPRAVICGGLVVFVLGSVGFALTSGALAAIGFRSLQGIGAGAVTVAGVALVATDVASTSRGSAFALLYGSQSLALAIGPLVGGILGASSMRLLFLLAAVLAGAATGPVLVALPPRGSFRTGSSPSGSVGGLAGLGDGAVPAVRPGLVALFSSRALVGAIIVFAAEGLLSGLYESCWSLLLHVRGATSFEIGLSWTLYCLPYALLSAPAGRLADRQDRRLLAMAGLVTSGLFAVAYPEVHDVALLVGVGCLEAVGAVLVVPAVLAVVAAATPPERQGSAQGALATARTATTALAAAGCGALFGAAVLLPFLAISIALVASGIALGWSWRGEPHRSPAVLRGAAIEE